MPDRSRHSTRIRLEEPITPFDACRHDVSRILIDEQTEFQRLQIVESPTLGRALILDEKWQSSTSDAHIYHEPLVHGAMLHHALANDRPGPRSVLIAGGGDWMSAREALRWKSVERVVLAEIDQRVLDASRYHFPEFHAGCEDDPRLEVIVGDATAVLDEASSSDRTRFDVIIGDLSDPIEEGPAADLFTVEAYQRVHAALTPGGVFATQAGGVAPAEVAAHARTRARLHRVFERAFTAIAPVQIFGTPLGLCFASDAPIDPSPSPERANRIMGANEIVDTQYLDAQTFSRLAFAPPYLEQAVADARRSI
jgi:spermidine synthase